MGSLLPLWCHKESIAAKERLLELDDGVSITELEGPERVSPNAIGQAFQNAIGVPVTVEAVPRDSWEIRFREQGMTNPTPRIQMLDGFNEGWIEFCQVNARVARGSTRIAQVIGSFVNKEINQ